MHQTDLKNQDIDLFAQSLKNLYKNYHKNQENPTIEEFKKIMTMLMEYVIERLDGKHEKPVHSISPD